MKKFIMSAALFAAACVVMVSCGGDKKATSETEVEVPEAVEGLDVESDADGVDAVEATTVEDADVDEALEEGRDAVDEALEEGRDAVDEAYDKAKDAVDKAKDVAKEKYGEAKDKVNEAIENADEDTKDAVKALKNLKGAYDALR